MTTLDLPQAGGALAHVAVQAHRDRRQCGGEAHVLEALEDVADPCPSEGAARHLNVECRTDTPILLNAVVVQVPHQADIRSEDQHALEWRNHEVQDRIGSLGSQLSALSKTWRDQENKKFAEEFEQHMRGVVRFIEIIERHIPYLARKAEIIEEYMQQR